MSTHGTFPTTIEEQYSYFTTVVPYLNVPANTARLFISATNLNSLNTLYSHPNPLGVTAPDNLGYIELFALHGSPSGKSPLVTKLFHQRIKQELIADPLGLENVLREIYADIPASALTPADRLTLKLPKKKARGAHRVATKNTVNWKTVALGGGDMLTTCQPSGSVVLNPLAATARGTSKKTRAHKEAGYDIRTSYIILKQGAALPTDANAAGMTQVVDTRAKMVRHLGTANASTATVTNIIAEFKQWHDPKHPNLDSPWVGPQICIIT
jgi:hypothetical protein